jgi:hypothetical protein
MLGIFWHVQSVNVNNLSILWLKRWYWDRFSFFTCQFCIQFREEIRDTCLEHKTCSFAASPQQKPMIVDGHCCLNNYFIKNPKPSQFGEKMPNKDIFGTSLLRFCRLIRLVRIVKVFRLKFMQLGNVTLFGFWASGCLPKASETWIWGYVGKHFYYSRFI